MFAQIASFLVDTVVTFFVFLLLLRFHFQWLRVPFRNPFGEFVLQTTSWMVMPVRRVIPGLAGLDLATLLLAWIIQSLGLWVQVLVSWINPYTPVAPVLDALTRPFLRPLRRFVPPIGNFDLTPLVLVVVIQVILIVLWNRR